jgi:hypothetical protein
MDIFEGNAARPRARQEMTDCTCGGVDFIEAGVLCTDPKVALAVFAYLMDEVPTQVIGALVPKVFSEFVVLGGIIIHAAEEGAKPNPALLILVVRIQDIVRDGVGIFIFLLDQDGFMGQGIVNDQACFRGKPPFFIRMLKDFVDLDGITPWIPRKNIPYGIRLGIEHPGPIAGSDDDAVIPEWNDVLHLEETAKRGLKGIVGEPVPHVFFEVPGVGRHPWGSVLRKCKAHHAISISSDLARTFLNAIQPEIADDPKVMMGVFPDKACFSLGDASERSEGFLQGIEQVDARMRAHPQPAPAVFLEADDGIAAQAGGVVKVIAESFKVVSVESVQAIPRPEPHEPLAVLRDARDRIAGNAIPNLVVLKVVGLYLG